MPFNFMLRLLSLFPYLEFIACTQMLLLIFSRYDATTGGHPIRQMRRSSNSTSCTDIGGSIHWCLL